MRALSRFSASTALVTFGILWATSAAAQTASAPAVEESAASDQDIVVTARKRDERLQDVPAAITAVGGAEMTRYSTNTLSQISSRVPQLQIGNVGGPGGATINLRGVGSPGTSPSVDQAVSINIDGVQVSQGNAVNLGVYDLGRVEVLKGPQALFYGKNSLGGIVSLVSADPGKNLEWMARAGYGFTEKRKQLEVMVSAPLSDTLGIRLVGAVGDQEGWFRNRLNSAPANAGVGSTSVADQTDFFLRGTLKFDAPGGSFDARLKVAYAKIDRDNGVATVNQLFSCPLGAPQLQVFNGNPTTGADCQTNRFVSEAQPSAATRALLPYYFAGEDGSFFKQEQFLTSLQMNWQLAESLKLTSVTGYYDYNEHWSYNASAGEIETVVTASRGGDKQFTQELRLASSFQSPVNFVIGGFYQDAKKRFAAPLVFNGFLTGGTGPLVFTDDRYRQSTSAYSIFAQGIFTLSDQFELTAGGRYSHESKDISGQKFTSALSGFSANPLNLIYALSKSSFNDFSPEITARFQPSANLTLYAAYREGFTSGGFNMAPGASPPPVSNNVSFDQAHAKGFEVGFKGTAADRQVSFDVSAYNYDYTGLQLNAFDPATISVQVRNAASSRSRGAEAALTFTPNAVPGLTLRSSVAYNHSRYKDYRTAPCYAGQSVAQGCNLLLVPRFNQAGVQIDTSYSAQDLSGTQVARAPDWTMSHGFTFETPVSSSLTLSFGGDANYTDSFNPEPAANPRALQRDAWRLNGFVSLKGASDRWELSLIGRNLTNTLRYNSVFEFPVTGAAYPGTPSPGLGADLAGGYTAPRTVMLQVTIRN
jgi:iron complex outermembrane receptor protein